MREDVITVPEVAVAPFNVSLAGVSYCDGSYKIVRPRSEVTCVEYVLSGCGVVHCGTKTAYPCAGDMYILPNNMDHRYYSDSRDPWVKIWVNLVGDLPLHILTAYGLNRTIWYEKQDGSGFIRKMYAICRDGAMTPYEKQNACAREFLGLAQFLASGPARQGNGPEAEFLRDYLDCHVDGMVGVEELADQISKSVSQTIRIFKKAYGVTPYEYFLARKLERAKLLLRSTNQSIKEIASSLCFADEHYFSGFFKKKTGSSPSQYRGIKKEPGKAE